MGETTVTKTLKASVVGLTKSKRDCLDFEYDGFQWWMLFGVDKGILSCYKAAKGYKQKVAKYKEYPLPIDARFIREWFRERNNSIADYWIKIPSSKRRGVGLWLPLKFHQPIPENFEIREAKIIHNGGKYYFHLCVSISAQKSYFPKTMLGVDLGLRHPATVVDFMTRHTYFLGEKLKQVKGKYFYLRRKLGQEKNIKQIKKMRNKERRKTKTLLHQLSRLIVNLAKELKAILIIGHLKGIRKDSKGRKFNRKVGSMPYYSLSHFIEYKAREVGVPTVFVNEHNTSKTCSVCGGMGSRRGNWFSCSVCGFGDNADRNAAFNIARRGSSHVLELGVEASAQKLVKLKEQASTTQRLLVCN